MLTNLKVAVQTEAYLRRTVPAPEIESPSLVLDPPKNEAFDFLTVRPENRAYVSEYVPYGKARPNRTSSQKAIPPVQNLNTVIIKQDEFASLYKRGEHKLTLKIEVNDFKWTGCNHKEKKF